MQERLGLGVIPGVGWRATEIKEIAKSAEDAGFDAVFVLRQLGKDRPDCREATAKAGRWALTCRNPDGGFGHFPGCTSDMDAVFFQVGTLVMAGTLNPADPLPRDPQLLGWGHLFPVP